MTVQEIKQVAESFGMHPSKGKGQNFLIQPSVVEKIVAACRLTGREHVLEVGPGFGVLTEKLLQKAKSVTAVELDHRLVLWLQEHFASETKLEIISQDILKYHPVMPFDLLVTNLPYAISGAFFRHVLSWANRPPRMIVMIQREVAERICAVPPDMNLLGLSVQLAATPKILFRVAPGSFWPPPRVESAVIELIMGTFLFFEDEKEKRPHYEDVMRLAKIGFAHPRKKLASNLAEGLPARPGRVVMDLGDLGFDKNVRAEQLAASDWRQLTRALGRTN